HRRVRRRDVLRPGGAARRRRRATRGEHPVVGARSLREDLAVAPRRLRPVAELLPGAAPPVERGEAIDAVAAGLGQTRPVLDRRAHAALEPGEPPETPERGRGRLAGWKARR